MILAVLTFIAYLFVRRRRNLAPWIGLGLVLAGVLSGTFYRVEVRKTVNRLEELKWRNLEWEGMVTGEAQSFDDEERIPIRISRVGGRQIPSLCLAWYRSRAGSNSVPPGTVVKVWGRVRAITVEKFPSTQERKGFRGSLRGNRWEIVGRQTTLAGWLYDIKVFLRKRGEATLSPPVARFLHGMLYGDETELTELEEAMSDIGVIHLISVSGLHVGFIVALIVGIGGIMRLPKQLLYLLVVLFVPLFVLMVGANAPAVRSGIMTLLIIGGLWVGRPIDGMNLLGGTAAAYLLFCPTALFDPSFQLSFSATAGILGLYPYWRSGVPAVWRPAADPFLASLAAQVGVAPIAAYYFGTFPWVGIIANLVVVPLGSLAVQLGLMAEVLGSLMMPATVVINACNEYIIRILIFIVRWFDSWASPIVAPSWWLILIFYGFFYLWAKLCQKNPVTGERRAPPKVHWVMGALCTLSIAIYIVGFDRNGFEVVFFDVGQGDAALVTTDDGYRLMIDGGTREEFRRRVRPYLKRHGIRRLDGVLLSHAHDDHLGGLLELTKDRRFEIKKVFEPSVANDSESYEEFIRRISQRGIPCQRVRRGFVFSMGKTTQGEVHWPPAGPQAFDDLNQTSVILRINHQGWDILFMGDAEQEAEEAWFRQEQTMDPVDILKVGHHGSRASTGRELLKTMRPKAAIISVGRRNRYGHPHRQLLRRIGEAGTKVYRTDRDGTIVVRFEPKRFKIRREVRS